ncbi:endospore germination permease [Clostridium oceanicum]|uniref:Endospore germination permease n=2 Tax=Clostridium oceanicum TaxID=1543 RepID=A0ABN1JV06_9CLOT
MIFIIIGVAIVSLKTYPVVFLVDGRNSSWVGTIIASVIIFFYYLYIIRVMKKTKKYDMWDIYKGAFGKYIGGFLFSVLIINLFLVLVESCSVEANCLHTNLLQNTPIWFIMAMFIISSIYVMFKGNKAIILTTILGISFICVAGINLGFLTFKYKKLKYLFPIFENGISFGFLKSTIKILGLYANILISAFYISQIKNKKNVKKISIIGLIIVIQMIIVSTTGVISTFGIDRAVTMAYPKLVQTELASYFGILEVGELFVMLQMVAGWFIKYIVAFEALLIAIKHLNIKNKRKIIIVIISIIAGVLCLIVNKNIYRLLFTLQVYSYICFVNFFVIPIVVFLIFSIKNNMNKNKKNKGNLKGSQHLRKRKN